MILTERNKAFLTLHVAVILFGFTAILGGLIDLSAFAIVWWRVVITCASLLFIVNLKKIFHLPKKAIFTYLGIGCIIALHWVAFYGSIKLSNASTTLVCLATTSLFTVFNEPLFLKKKLQTTDILYGLAIIPCMWYIADDLDYSLRLGAVVGLISAYLASLFNVLNKKHLEDIEALPLTFIEMCGVLFFITLFLPFIHPDLAVIIPKNGLTWIYLTILALVCTTFAWVVSMHALRRVTAFEATLVINLEPVYGIILAIFLLKEHQELNPRFYVGASLIGIIVMSYPLLKRYQKFKYDH